jgi:hypothetical protein
MDLDFNRPNQDNATPAVPPVQTPVVAPVDTPVAVPVSAPTEPQNAPAAQSEPASSNIPLAVQTPSTPAAGASKWQSASDDEVLEADLIKELNLESSPQEEQDALILRMTDVLQKSVISQLLETLNEDQKKELDEAMAKDDPQVTMEFLQKTTPDMDELAKKELIRFKRAMLTGKI